jgi:hypothetical protein
MRSFCMASSCSRPIGGHGGGAEVCWHVELVHDHIWWRVLGHLALPLLWLLYAPSAIISFASLDTCKSPVEFDISF